MSLYKTLEDTWEKKSTLRAEYEILSFIDV